MYRGHVLDTMERIFSEVLGYALHSSTEEVKTFTIEYTTLTRNPYIPISYVTFLQVKIYIEHIHLNILRATFNLGRDSICNSTWNLVVSYCPWNFEMQSSQLSLYGVPKNMIIDLPLSKHWICQFLEYNRPPLLDTHANPCMSLSQHLHPLYHYGSYMGSPKIWLLTFPSPSIEYVNSWTIIDHLCWTLMQTHVWFWDNIYINSIGSPEN